MLLVRYLACIWISPLASARYGNRHGAENAYQPFACRFHSFVAVDGQHEPAGKVDPLRVALRPEGRDRRTEHDFLAGVGAPAGEPCSGIYQLAEAAPGELHVAPARAPSFAVAVEST